MLFAQHLVRTNPSIDGWRPDAVGLEHGSAGDAFRHRDTVQRRLLPLGDRLAEMLFRQRFERRQRLVRLRTVGDQANGVAVTNLQQRQLIEAARIDALPLLLQHQLGLERRQRLDQPRRRARMQPVRVLHRPGYAFALRQRQGHAFRRR